MLGRSTTQNQSIKHRRRSWFGGCRKHNDNGDPLAGALVALAIISFIGLVGTALFQFIDRGQAAVVQQVQEGIRADITAMIGQRINVETEKNYATSSVKAAAVLSSINTDSAITYTALVSAGADAKTGSVVGDAGTAGNIYDINDAEPNKDFWVFMPHTSIELCEQGQTHPSGTKVEDLATKTAGTVTGSTATDATRADPNNDLANLLPVDCDGTTTTTNGNVASVRAGRAVFVGGVTETGSHFCIKYTQSNKALKSNGFAYWHVNKYVTPVSGGTGASPGIATILNDIQADCGVFWLINQYTGAGSTAAAGVGVYHPAWVAPGICAHSDPRPSPQDIPAC